MKRSLLLTTTLLGLCAFAAEAKTVTKVFPNAMLSGQRVDACLKKGGACGQAAADKFCREVNFQSARKFSSLATPSGTIYISTGAQCQSGCKALVNVACMKEVKSSINVEATTESDFGDVGD